MDRHEIKRQETGVDWVTYTARRSEDPQRLWLVGRELISEQDRWGEKVEPLKRGGYEGWRTSHVELGRREDGTLLRISSDVASSKWMNLEHVSGRPTRLDLQVTLTFNSSTPSFGWYTLRSTPTNLPSQQSRRQLSAKFATTGLFIGTLGARQSDRYIRVYDKGVESGDAPRGKKWRIELEAKGARAQHLWRSLLSAPQRDSFCSSAVWQSLRELGGRSLVSSNDCLPALESLPVVPRSVQKKLEYLRRFVTPMVASLEQLGYGEMARAILTDGFRSPPDRRVTGWDDVRPPS